MPTAVNVIPARLKSLISSDRKFYLLPNTNLGLGFERQSLETNKVIYLYVFIFMNNITFLSWVFIIALVSMLLYLLYNQMLSYFWHSRVKIISSNYLSCDLWAGGIQKPILYTVSLSALSIIHSWSKHTIN